VVKGFKQKARTAAPVRPRSLDDGDRTIEGCPADEERRIAANIAKQPSLLAKK
jgi:hypothetical protein